MDEIAAMGQIYLRRRRFQSEALRPFGITFMQLRMITLARRRGAVKPSDAAKELDCDRPTATVIAANCVARGWLLRRESASDKRSKKLELSGEGEELLDRIESTRVLSGGREDPLDVLGIAERELIAAAIEKVRIRAGELYGGDGGFGSFGSSGRT